MEAIAALVLAVILIWVGSMAKRDAEEFGPGCAGFGIVIFIAVLFVTVAGFVAAR